MSVWVILAFLFKNQTGGHGGYTCDPSIQEVKARGLCVQGSLDHVARSCLRSVTQTKSKMILNVGLKIAETVCLFFIKTCGNFNLYYYT